MITRPVFAMLLLLVAAFVFQWLACGDINLADDAKTSEDDDDSSDDDAADDDSSQTDLTWNNFAEDFFHDYCRECHRNPPDEGAPYSLETYEEVYPKIGAIRYQVVDLEQMPPAEDDKKEDEKDDDFPSTAERQNLAEWIDAGAPEN